ncbi:MAG: hypothetical protein AB3N13_09880 [Arenibacterium sp.]
MSLAFLHDVGRGKMQGEVSKICLVVRTIGATRGRAARGRPV